MEGRITDNSAWQGRQCHLLLGSETFSPVACSALPHKCFITVDFRRIVQYTPQFAIMIRSVLFNKTCCSGFVIDTLDYARSSGCENWKGGLDRYSSRPIRNNSLMPASNEKSYSDAADAGQHILQL